MNEKDIIDLAYAAFTADKDNKQVDYNAWYSLPQEERIRYRRIALAVVDEYQEQQELHSGQAFRPPVA